MSIIDRCKTKIRLIFGKRNKVQKARSLLEEYCSRKCIGIEFDSQGTWIVYDGFYIRYNEKYNSISKIIFDNGVFETQEIKFMNKNLSENAVLFDIGCNVGMYSLSALSKHPTIKVHSFEASKDTFNDLIININKNDFQNLIIKNNVAVGNDFQKVYITSDFHSSNFIVDSDVALEKCAVQMLTIDSYIKEQKIERLDFVKIDVEGSEHNVILGAIESIKKFQPTILIEMIEKETSTGEFSNRNVQDYKLTIKLLCSVGYKYYVLDDTDTFVKMDRMDTGVFLNSFHNYVFYINDVIIP